MKKLLVIAAANNFNFIKDIGTALCGEDLDVHFWTGNNSTLTGNSSYTSPEKQFYEVLYTQIKDADVVWLEWADGMPIEVLRSYNRKFILRIHHYELFRERTLQMISEIDPEKISQLIFVSPYMKEIAVSKFPWMKKGVVIPNLIDTDKWPFHNRPRGTNLMFLGRISYVKNLPMLLHFFNELWLKDHKYKLHVIGDISDSELNFYQDNLLKKLNPSPSVRFYGRIPHDQLLPIMQQVHYVVSTSISESQGVGILEAMATGIKPAIYSFGGAERQYLDEHLFLMSWQFSRIIQDKSYDPASYRQFVLRKYSIKNNLWRYREVIDNG